MDRHRDLFWSLVEPEHLKARSYCRKLMRNREDGDDLYQDALVSALTRFESLKQTTSFKPWLYRIIINAFKNRIRRPWWKRLAPMSAEIEETAVGDNPVPRHAARRRLEIAFGAVSAENRALITLFELEGWTIAELAGVTGKSVGGLKVRLSRTRAKMREALVRYLERSEWGQPTETIGSKDKVCVATKPAKD